MVQKYAYLKDNELTFKAIWAWARRLVTDLNSAAAEAANSQQAVPSGSLQMFAGTTLPAGWLWCDGGSYTKSDYPILFLAIGYTWGGGGESFNVPDLRGKFLFGADSSYALASETGRSSVPTADISTLDVLDSTNADAKRRLLLGTTTNGAVTDTSVPTGAFSLLPPSTAVNYIIKA